MGVSPSALLLRLLCSNSPRFGSAFRLQLASHLVASCTCVGKLPPCAAALCIAAAAATAGRTKRCASKRLRSRQPAADWVERAGPHTAGSFAAGLLQASCRTEMRRWVAALCVRRRGWLRSRQLSVWCIVHAIPAACTRQLGIKVLCMGREVSSGPCPRGLPHAPRSMHSGVGQLDPGGDLVPASSLAGAAQR